MARADFLRPADRGFGATDKKRQAIDAAWAARAPQNEIVRRATDVRPNNTRPQIRGINLRKDLSALDPAGDGEACAQMIADLDIIIEAIEG